MQRSDFEQQKARVTRAELSTTAPAIRSKSKRKDSWTLEIGLDSVGAPSQTATYSGKGVIKLIFADFGVKDHEHLVGKEAITHWSSGHGFVGITAPQKREKKLY